MGGGEVIKKGWLIKSPPLEASGIKNWRKRFFKLRSSKVLEYYKSEDGDLKGVINVEDCKAVNSDLFHKKYKYVFDIETHDRIYYLVASSLEEMKNWVDTLCNVCGFTLQATLVNEYVPSSKTMATPKPSKGDAVISPPVSTLPHSKGGVLFSDQFKPEEPQSDVYSLASAAIYDVNNQLGRKADVPAGTPLSEALTAKGMSAGPGPVISSGFDPSTNRLPDSAYFSPRPADGRSEIENKVSDPSSLYSVPNKKGKLSSLAKPQSATSLDLLESSSHRSNKHRALTGTVSDAVTYSSPPSGEELSRHATTSGYRPAETMANGYMRPAQWTNRPRPSNYDQVPPGPPRPAFVPDDTPSSSPHRSALLRRNSDHYISPSDQQRSGSRTYINMRELHDELGLIEAPPMIDRGSKPPNPSPPRVRRNLKPGQREGQSPPESYAGHSSPNFPTRSASLSAGTVPGDPNVLSNVLSDIPKPTNRTMQYTQVQFDPKSGQLCVSDDNQTKDLGSRAPVPLPRGGQGPKAKPRRVNYSHIDINATQQLATGSGEQDEEESDTRRLVSLGEAERQALSEKHYVNVARDGYVDDETNPDYYTHMRDMRDFTEQLYYTMTKDQNETQNTEDQLYQAPRDTS